MIINDREIRELVETLHYEDLLPLMAEQIRAGNLESLEEQLHRLWCDADDYARRLGGVKDKLLPWLIEREERRNEAAARVRKAIEKRKK